MDYFRRVINGPPCNISARDSSLAQFTTDAAKLNDSENTLIDWMCGFTKAQKQSVSSESLIQIWESYLQDIGITIFTYYHVPSHSGGTSEQCTVMTHFGLSDVWKQSENLQGFDENNPLTSYALERNELFKFSDVLHFKGRTSREEKYFKSFRDLDFSEGYALPVFSAGKYHGFFTLGLGAEREAFTERQLTLVNWACQIGHYRFIDLMTKEAEQANQSGSIIKLNTLKSTQLLDKEASQKVIAELNQANIASKAQNKDESYLFQISAAKRYGYEEPFTEAQRDLNYTLMKMTAPKDVTQDAWKLYHMLRS